MDNIIWGARRGLAFAGVLSVFVLIMSTVNGEAFTKLGVSLPEVILLYAIGGVLGGGVVGALRPWAGTRLGAMATGVVAAVPVSLAFGVAFYGAPSHWRRTDLVSCLLYAIIMGIVGGNALWSQRARSADRKLPM